MLDSHSWRDHFPGLAGIAPQVQDILDKRARHQKVPAGTAIFEPGYVPENLLLLISGTVRVQQLSEGGREIVLYRVHAGESCVLTTACLLAHEGYSAEGIAETDLEAIAIPKAVFEELMSTSPEFRAFVFAAYSKRITDLFVVIEEIAFKRMDVRLAQSLLELRDAQNQLSLTHQQLAAELGTAREVVTRQLQEFQRRDWVQLSRGHVQVANVPELEKLARA